MNILRMFLVLLAVAFAVPVSAQKLLLAHVAVNPSQGMLHLAKDSGILAKYGFTADVLLIPARRARSRRLSPAISIMSRQARRHRFERGPKARTSRFSRLWRILQRNVSLSDRIHP